MTRAAVGATASTTITQPVGSQTKASLLTRALLGVRKVFFTQADLEDPAALYKVLTHLQDNAIAALHPLSSNPTIEGNVLVGVVFTAGQTLTLSHGLGRAYSGWYVVRAQTNAASIVEAAQPTGVTADKCITLTSANAGTYSVWIY